MGTLLALAFIGIVGGQSSEPINWPGVAMVAIVTAGTVVVFGLGLWVIVLLWRMVLDLLANGDKQSTIALRAVFGEIKTRAGKARVMGSGLLGTLVILAFCTLVCIYGLWFRFGTDGGQAVANPPDAHMEVSQ